MPYADPAQPITTAGEKLDDLQMSCTHVEGYIMIYLSEVWKYMDFGNMILATRRAPDLPD